MDGHGQSFQSFPISTILLIEPDLWLWLANESGTDNLIIFELETRHLLEALTRRSRETKDETHIEVADKHRRTCTNADKREADE